MDNHNLPPDIISDVLLRLPIKSIGRFRCVSKPWLSLISESGFVKEHLHRSITDDNTRIILSDSDKIMLANPSQLEPREDFDDKLVDIDLPLLGFDSLGLNNYGASVEGSCHGLVVIRVTRYDDRTNNIFVCNPCTRDVRQLPKLDYTPNNDVSFDGIGYDSSSDDYKVLVCGNVFSFKSNSWKKPTPIPCESSCFLRSGGVFFNGCIHWIVRRNFKEEEIVSFDLATEQYLESPQLQLPPEPPDPEPESYRAGIYYKRLFVTGTYLSLFVDELHEIEYQVWVMKDEGAESAWTKSYVVVYGNCHYYVWPVCLLKNGELLLHADDSFLVLYNPKDGTNRIFCPGDHVITNVYSYIESLVSPYRVHETGLVEQ